MIGGSADHYGGFTAGLQYNISTNVWEAIWHIRGRNALPASSDLSLYRYNQQYYTASWDSQASVILGASTSTNNISSSNSFGSSLTNIS